VNNQGFQDVEENTLNHKLLKRKHPRRFAKITRGVQSIIPTNFERME